MKIKKILLSLLVVVSISISFGFTSCFDSNNDDIQSFDNTITNTAPSIFTITDDLSTIATNYMGAIATVSIVRDNSISAWGSGVCIADGGFVATNYHVISLIAQYPETYSISLEMTIDGVRTTDVSANLIWYDAELDLAVIRSEQNFDTLMLMSDRWIDATITTKLKIAEEVWTLGTPFSNELFGTFSKGTISSLYYRTEATEVNSQLYVHEYLIQHSASISNGNSGGGLFDATGKLVGINTLGYASTSTNVANDLYFAIPIYPLTLIIDDIIAAETDGDDLTNFTNPTFGILSCYDSNFKDYDSHYTFSTDGVFVSNISATSSGYINGMRVGNVVVGIGNSTCTGTEDESYADVSCKYDYKYALLNYSAGDSITVYFKANVNSTIISSAVVELS